MAEPPRQFPTGEALCEYVRSVSSDTVILGFSNGKDAVATWLQLRRFFKRVVPFYLYLVPGLRFIDESLAYYERFFGERIRRYPDPVLYMQLANHMMQTPASSEFWRKQRMRFDIEVGDYLAELQREHPEAWRAEGWRSADSFRRRLVIQKYGAYRTKERKFYPVFDWTELRMVEEFKREGVELPVDYRLFNRSFEALNYRYLEPLRRYYPDDLERIRLWFPLVDAQFARRRFYEEKRRGQAAGEKPEGGRAQQAPGPLPEEA